MSKHMVIGTVMTQFQNFTTTKIDELKVFEGDASKEEAVSEFLTQVKAYFDHLSELEAAYVVWDGEDIDDEESRFYGVDDLSEVADDYEQELVKNQELIYRWDDGCSSYMRILKIVELP